MVAIAYTYNVATSVSSSTSKTGGAQMLPRQVLSSDGPTCPWSDGTE